MKNTKRINLIRIRKNNGLKVKDIANLLGISMSHYYKIEEGIRNPNLETSIKLSKILGSTIEELFSIDKLDDSSQKAV
ncbi:helix-turn-helix transcriptional regulator [Thermoanaerobacterium sp. RBIITD]|jgi:putative transcriptional regulator|uniref:helix-turn-helix transcriptional regulator n=1 Tax=Thermoanaerobacterium sp. RBIITD TaxID=1550240 RepID=UPI000BB977AE|nr:helix-turn-helix transcriptional regulator [Thermoanaerobacterium sp. RBIITD]SNX54042.1 putative transcriptional regulator [Thermoanaerobacterium sp. RBIITD]